MKNKFYFGLLIFSMGVSTLTSPLLAQDITTPQKIKHQLKEWTRRLNSHAKEKDRLANLLWELDNTITEQEALMELGYQEISALEDERLATLQAFSSLQRSQSRLLSTYLQSLNLKAHFERRRYIPLVTSPLRTQERRLMRYYGYYELAMHKALAQQASECEALMVLNVKMLAEQHQKEVLHQKQEKQLEALKQLHDKRHQALLSLKSSFSTDTKQVESLQQQLENLNHRLMVNHRLVEENELERSDDLSFQTEYIKPPPSKTTNRRGKKARSGHTMQGEPQDWATLAKTAQGKFWERKGKLFWPLEHQHPVVEKDPIHPGTRLIAPAGTPVRAIHGGKVLYADHLKGLGLLVIVDHGRGYMSLYGDNESLYVKTGDVIKTFDLIGRVGTPGTVNHSSLYLEIRKDGKPLQLSTWFLP